MLALFQNKKCCNWFNFVPCILWDFIVLGLVLNWWRIEHVLDEQVDFMSVLRETTREKATWEAHVRSWKVVSGCQFREWLARRANPRDIHKIPCLEDFKCDFLTLHPYYIYPHYQQKYEKPFREKNPR